MGYRQGKRRKMTKFSITELSSVDRPAQEGARALLMKRRGDPDYDPKNPDRSKRGRNELAVVKSPFDDESVGVLTSSNEGHQHLVWLGHGKAGETSWQKSEGEENGHDHPWMMNSDGTITVGDSEGHGHDVDAGLVMQAIMSLAKKRPEPKEGEALEDGTWAIVDKADLRDAIIVADFCPSDVDEVIMTHLRKRSEALGAEDVPAGDGATKEANMADNTEAVTLETVEKERDDLQAELNALKAAAEEVPAEEPVVEKSDPEVVYTSPDGTVFTKSDDPRLVKMAQDRDEDRKELAKARAAQAHTELCKRAESYDAYPGELSVRAEIVKALDTIEDEEARKAAFEALTAGNEALKGAFSTLGNKAVPQEVADADAELDRLAKELSTKDGVDYYEAYEKVSQANRELLAKATLRN